MRWLAAIALVASCGGSCGLDLERMIDQPRYTTYEACEVCPEGTIMMTPPRGTVPRSAALEPAEIATGADDRGRPLVDIPIPVDAQLIARGRDRYDIFCAACHGRLGDGLTQVAENMRARRPPNLIAEPYASRPPGRIFAVISGGFGLMRSYAAELPVRDRWAVTAYVQVLTVARGVALDELPTARRQEAQRWLK